MMTSSSALPLAAIIVPIAVIGLLLVVGLTLVYLLRCRKDRRADREDQLNASNQNAYSSQYGSLTSLRVGAEMTSARLDSDIYGQLQLLPKFIRLAA